MNKHTMQEILPLGSIVLLHGGNKKVMICGRIQEDKKTGRIYDYAACYYPEGILNPNELFLFQHEDIQHVEFVGLQDHDESAFCAFMEEKLKEMNML